MHEMSQTTLLDFLTLFPPQNVSESTCCHGLPQSPSPNLPCSAGASESGADLSSLPAAVEARTRAPLSAPGLRLRALDWLPSPAHQHAA